MSSPHVTTRQHKLPNGLEQEISYDDIAFILSNENSLSFFGVQISLAQSTDVYTHVYISFNVYTHQISLSMKRPKVKA